MQLTGQGCGEPKACISKKLPDDVNLADWGPDFNSKGLAWARKWPDRSDKSWLREMRVGGNGVLRTLHPWSMAHGGRARFCARVQEPGKRPALPPTVPHPLPASSSGTQRHWCSPSTWRLSTCSSSSHSWTPAQPGTQAPGRVAPQWPSMRRGNHRSRSLETGQTAEGKAYGIGGSFMKGGFPRDAVQAGVWGAGKSLWRRGRRGEGAAGGEEGAWSKGMLSAHPGAQHQAEGRARGGARLAKKGSRNVWLSKGTLTFSKANILTVRLKWNLLFFTGDREKDCILEFVCFTLIFTLFFN